MIRVHADDPPLTARETAAIGRMTALAALRKGVYTTAQQSRIDAILDGAKKRATKGSK